MNKILSKSLRLKHQRLIEQPSENKHIDQDAQKKLNSIMFNPIGQFFFTVFDFDEFEFKERHRIEKHLGYTGNEFNIKSLNNDSTQKFQITHTNDIGHVLRYNTIIYELLAKPPKGCQFELLTDNYEILFRIRHKDGHFLRVRRKCFLMSLKNGRPKTHLDTWEILHNDYNTNVIIRFQTKNLEMNEAVTESFYELNCKELDFYLTPREKDIVAFKEEGLFDKEVADRLGVSRRTVEKRLLDLKKRINDFLEKNKIKKYVGTNFEMIQFLKSFGLLLFKKNSQHDIP
ncbi:MAG: LuxR C-terminal-related transcriptional regulator [Bacteroidota bacterium]